MEATQIFVSLFFLANILFCLAYAFIRYACFPALTPPLQLLLSVVVCGGLALLFFGRVGIDQLAAAVAARRQSLVDAQPRSDESARQEAEPIGV